jgi:hypothetical protein
MALLVGVERNEVKPWFKESYKKGCETSSKDSKMGLTLNEFELQILPPRKIFLGLTSFLIKFETLSVANRWGF